MDVKLRSSTEIAKIIATQHVSRLDIIDGDAAPEGDFRPCPTPEEIVESCLRRKMGNGQRNTLLHMRWYSITNATGLSVYLGIVPGTEIE
ncbi:MAG: hypothetical protein ACYTEQ_01235 [Planctomycetota bacterium]|jgi:hypothetical protein